MTSRVIFHSSLTAVLCNKVLSFHKPETACDAFPGLLETAQQDAHGHRSRLCSRNEELDSAIRLIAVQPSYGVPDFGRARVIRGRVVSLLGFENLHTDTW